MVFKCQLGDEYVKLALEGDDEINFANLQKVVQEKFNITSCVIKYYDVQGDLTLMTTEDDFAFACAEKEQSDDFESPYRIVVTATSSSSSSPSSSSSSSAETKSDSVIVTQMCHLKYDPSKAIASGAYGSVHTGTFKDNPVAIKVLIRGFSALSDFTQEANVMAGLSSPYLVRLIAITLEPQCMIMELMHCSLFQFLHQAPLSKIEWSLQWSLVNEMVQGISFLHERGIIHRDLKSANVLLTSDYHVKLCDFGLSREQDTATGAAQTLESKKGTIPYMAPELFASKPCTPAVDIYALGILMYEVAYRLI